MSQVYDNWERLVAAVLKKQQLWQLFHEHSRTPSTSSEASESSTSIPSRRVFNDPPYDFSILEVEKAHKGSIHNGPRTLFATRELPAATNNFRAKSLLGEGGFGRLFKGQLEGTKQRIRNALLPVPRTSKALPAPTKVTTPTLADSAVQKSESVPEIKLKSKLQTFGVGENRV